MESNMTLGDLRGIIYGLTGIQPSAQIIEGIITGNDDVCVPPLGEMPILT